MPEEQDPEAATLAAAGGRDPELGLRAVAALRGLLEVLEALQVDNARANGWSWQDIASRLGVTKQAVHQKHGRPAGTGQGGSQMVRFTEPAGVVPELGRQEAESRRQYYIGPEHLLVGLLRQGDDAAARLLRDRGLDLATLRAGLDRLVEQGVLPGPQPSDAELLGSLGTDLDAVYGHLEQAFGFRACYDAAERLSQRPIHPVPHVPGAGTPLTCMRALVSATQEAATRGQEVTPLHLLLGPLRDAEDPVDTDLDPGDRRLRSMLGLPDHGPSPVRLLVEFHGLTLEQLRATVLAELDQGR